MFELADVARAGELVSFGKTCVGGTRVGVAVRVGVGFGSIWATFMTTGVAVKVGRSWGLCCVPRLVDRAADTGAWSVVPVSWVVIMFVPNSRLSRMKSNSIFMKVPVIVFMMCAPFIEIDMINIINVRCVTQR